MRWRGGVLTVLLLTVVLVTGCAAPGASSPDASAAASLAAVDASAELPAGPAIVLDGTAWRAQRLGSGVVPPGTSSWAADAR